MRLIADTIREIFGKHKWFRLQHFSRFLSLLFICAPVATVRINFIRFQVFRQFRGVTEAEAQLPTDSPRPKANLSGSSVNSALHTRTELNYKAV